MSVSRSLVHSMLTIGSAQAVKITLSVIRLKALAVLVGPTGLGLLSIYNNLQGMSTKAAGLGLAASGVREIASARGKATDLERIRRVLLGAHAVQGFLAMLGIWLLRDKIATWLFGSAQQSTEIGFIGLAVLLTLLMSSQQALLQGLRRIGDLGRVTVLGALAGTIAGLAAVWFYGKDGLIWFVLVQPLAGFAVALSFTRKLPTPTGPRPQLMQIWTTWKPMARLGAAFMLGGLATAGTLLLVRGQITRELGLDAAGLFAASWGITMTYVGFLLNAMAADYYPRLTEVISDREAAIRLMNHQAQLTLAIGGPVLLVLIGLAPLVIQVLYSSEFRPAATILQWQSAGNVFKLASWSLSYSIVAGAHAKTFLLTQLVFNAVFLGVVLWLLPTMGLLITGVGFVLGYAVYFATVFGIARRQLLFQWDQLSLKLLLTHLLLSLGLLVLMQTYPNTGAIAASLFAVVTAIVGLRVVLAKIGTTGRFAAYLANIFGAVGWPIRGES